MIETTDLTVEELKDKLAESKTVITFYTDPLCCWSWGMKPQLQQLSKAFKSEMQIKYCMGGLIEDWAYSKDQHHSINNPSQMGPLWMQASDQMNIPINYMVWMKDPPSSSFPPCLAVTAARLQSERASIQLFWKLSEAVMEKGLNVSKLKVIYEVVDDLLKDDADIIEIEQFKIDLLGQKSRIEFKKDLKKVSANSIERFPTLNIQNKQTNKYVTIIGYRSYEEILALLNEVL